MRSTPPDPPNPGDETGADSDKPPGPVAERFGAGAHFTVILVDPDPDHDWLPGVGLIRRVTKPLAEGGTPADDTIEIHRGTCGREALVLTIPGQHDPLALGQRIAAQLPEALLGVAASSGGKDLPHGTVLAVAAEGLDVARGGGTTRVIHSELYDLIARSLARRGQTEPPAQPIAPLAPEPLAPEPLAPEFRAPEFRARESQAPEPMREADDPFAHESPIPDGPTGRPLAPAPTDPALSVGSTAARSDGTHADRQATAAAELERSRSARRIEKLKGALEEAERENDRLRALVEGEKGLASQHREVQGLRDVDPKRREKQQLIDGLFAQNARPKERRDS